MSAVEPGGPAYLSSLAPNAGGAVPASVSANPSPVEIIEDITVEPVKGAEYNGYLVKVDGGAADGASLLAMKRSANGTIGDEIALVDRPEDALRFADAEDIEIIEPNYRLTAFDFPQSDPADPLYTDVNNYQWGIKYVNAATAWQAGYRGKDVNIAILDTGIVNAHEDLNNKKILSQYDWVNVDDNAEDDNMHGSVVGGIIAADTNNYALGTMNGVGMSGIVDEANLIIHKVLDRTGGGDVGDILFAYYDILESGERIDVVNLSLGHDGFLQLEYDLIQEMVDSGSIVIAATGNNGEETDGTANMINYPAGYDNVIGVGSVGRGGSVSGFSTKNKSVDVAAPGEFMVGLEAGTQNGYYVNYLKSGGQSYPLSGTSFAAPVVAAAAAIAKQRDKNIDEGAFLTAIKRTARDAGPAGRDTSYGYGVLDIANLVTYLQTKAITVTFDPNGGKVGSKSKVAWPGGKYGSLPTPTRGKDGFGGWYTAKNGGKKVTSASDVNSYANLTLYAHWQSGTTLNDIAASAGKLSPAFSYKKMNYKLTLSKSEASVKITGTKSSSGAKMQIKVGSGKYRTKSSVTVKLKRGKQATVQIKLTKKGVKSKTYKIKVKRRK
ncbi:MAG: S8 family serine peptidase [Clostridiales Family XIII bacterium]|nr:S8 family serine peptidase [Clostridiales Family XIII bacterium]